MSEAGHVAYFASEALWTYLTLPFLYSYPGFDSEEIEPWHENGEVWRQLRVTFPDHIASHTRTQVTHFGPDGLMRRHDYTVDILGGNPGANYTTNYKTLSGHQDADNAAHLWLRQNDDAEGARASARIPRFRQPRLPLNKPRAVRLCFPSSKRVLRVHGDSSWTSLARNRPATNAGSFCGGVYVSNNPVPVTDLPGLVKSVHGTLNSLLGGPTTDASATQKPAVPIRKSIGTDYVVCLEDGRKLKMLKRYLRSWYKLSPEEYRAKWGLPADYPMVAPNYAAQRSAFAKKIVIGPPTGRASAPQTRVGCMVSQWILPTCCDIAHQTGGHHVDTNARRRQEPFPPYRATH
jgi:predicted transcriptional regulator